MDQSLDSENLNQVFVVLPRLYRGIQASRLKMVKDCGVSRNQMDLLAALSEHGPQSLTALSRLMSIAKPNITTLVNELELSGFVGRNRNGQDKRIMLIHLTEKGIVLRTEGRKRIKTQYQEALAGLDSVEMHSLTEGMNVLSKLLELQCSCIPK